MKAWRALDRPRLERYRAEDFSRIIRWRRYVLYRGVVHVLH
jgi:hypothetical protein